MTSPVGVWAQQMTSSGSMGTADDFTGGSYIYEYVVGVCATVADEDSRLLCGRAAVKIYCAGVAVWATKDAWAPPQRLWRGKNAVPYYIERSNPLPCYIERSNHLPCYTERSNPLSCYIERSNPLPCFDTMARCRCL